jgi:aconitase B
LIGKGADVFLASAELAAVAAIEGNVVDDDETMMMVIYMIHFMNIVHHHHYYHHYHYHYRHHDHHYHHHLPLLFTGKLPTVAEYNKYAVEINKTAADTFRYLNFDKLPDFVATSKDVDLGEL